MSKTYLIAALAGVLLLHWLTTAHVTLTVAGFPVLVPMLAIAAAAVVTVTSALAALVVYRVRVERAMLAAWQARKVAAR